MTLQQQLREDMKVAMKAKETTKLTVIRGMMTAVTNELVATGKTPQDELDDTGVLAVIKRLAKQRKDSIDQYEAAGRQELADQEREELAILETYLPQTMSQEAIRPIAEAKKAELGIDDKSKMGIVVGAVMKETGGQADGADVKAVVESLF